MKIGTMFGPCSVYAALLTDPNDWALDKTDSLYSAKKSAGTMGTRTIADSNVRYSLPSENWYVSASSLRQVQQLQGKGPADSIQQQRVAGEIRVWQAWQGPCWAIWRHANDGVLAIKWFKHFFFLLGFWNKVNRFFRAKWFKNWRFKYVKVKPTTSPLGKGGTPGHLHRIAWPPKAVARPTNGTWDRPGPPRSRWCPWKLSVPRCHVPQWMETTWEYQGGPAIKHGWNMFRS